MFLFHFTANVLCGNIGLLFVLLIKKCVLFVYYLKKNSKNCFYFVINTSIIVTTDAHFISIKLIGRNHNCFGSIFIGLRLSLNNSQLILISYWSKLNFLKLS